MNTVVSLYSNKNHEIINFLRKFYNNDYLKIENELEWKKEFNNSIEIAEFIGIYIDNNDNYEITMWISLDQDVFIKITEDNANDIIKYLYERYPW